MTGSVVKAKTAATAQADFDLQKNGVSVGTVRFAAAGTVASYVSIAGFTMVSGDHLELVAPGSPDATLANLFFTLEATGQVSLMALLFAEGFDGWSGGSDLANATRSINAGAALGSGNTLSNWGDGCLVGSLTFLAAWDSA